MKKEKLLHNKGYICILKPNHKNASGFGYIYEHRYIMEKYLGRELLKTEDVHHIDGNHANNDISNLKLLSHKDHVRFHKGWKLIDNIWYKKCSLCHEFLKVNDNFYKRTRITTDIPEYISECKKCSRLKSKISQKQEKILKRKLIQCPICNKIVNKPSYYKGITCSSICGWILRRQKYGN